MASDNDAIRLRRLVFYAADVEQFNNALSAFVRKSGAHSVLLIDQEGHLVARQGFRGDGDGQALAALVAGSFTSTRQVARLLGESDFRVMTHQGPTTSIHLSLLGERTLQVAVFPSTVKPGMIQVLCKELATQVEGILVQASTRAPDPDQGIEQGFSDAMKNQLDSLFGGL